MLLIARLQYRQWISPGDTTALHQAINMKTFSSNTPWHLTEVKPSCVAFFKSLTCLQIWEISAAMDISYILVQKKNKNKNIFLWNIAICKINNHMCMGCPKIVEEAKNMILFYLIDIIDVTLSNKHMRFRKWNSVPISCKGQGTKPPWHEAITSLFVIHS